MSAFRRGGVAALLLCLVACPGSKAPAPSPTTPAAAKTPGVRGGTLNIAIADDAGALDPQLASEPGALGLIRATQRGLMAFPASSVAEGGTIPVPDLAEKMPATTADGLTYTFTLRKGVKLGDRALVSADVVAGITRAVRLGAASGAFRVIAGADAFVANSAPVVAGLAAPDPRTVRVTLTRPFNDVLWMLAIPAASAVPEGLAAAVSMRDIPSSGPYRLERWEPGVRMRLVRNTSWSAATDPIRAAWVNAIEVRVGAWNDADLAGEGLGGGPSVAVEGGCFVSLFMNPRVKPFDRVQVRKGVARALLRDSLARLVSQAQGAPATPTARLLADGETEPAAEVNLAEARRLIGTGFSTRIGYERRGPDARGDGAVAQALRGMLGQVRVAATPLLGPGAIGPSAYDLYDRGNVPMGVARWCPDWPGRSGRVVLGPLLGTGGVANYTRTADRELDRLIAAASVASSGADERSPASSGAWLAAEARALALTVVVPLVRYQEAARVASRVKGFVSHPLFTRGDPTNVWVS